MELQIHGKNLELNAETRDYIARKLDRLSRHLPGIDTATVEMTRENTRDHGQRVVAQVTIVIKGAVLRAEERGASASAAVDAVADVMDRRVSRYKGRAYRSEQGKKAGRTLTIRTSESEALNAEDSPADDETVQAGGKVVRIKRFPLKPETMDEAAFQMELLGHDFYLFFNSETQQHNVLYRRRAGDYGLIQPEPM